MPLPTRTLTVSSGFSLRHRLAFRRAAVILFLSVIPPMHLRAQAPAPSSPPAAQTAAPAAKPANPCQPKRTVPAAAPAVAPAAAQDAGPPKSSVSADLAPAEQILCTTVEPLINWYDRFLSGPQVKPMNPREKAWLAFRNVGDPFNGLTILASSAIAVGSNAHSPYGPGMHGFGESVGVSYSQDMTGEFLGTFLIPTLAHQDPHYHRMPTASTKRRIAHTVIQVAWTQGDNGRGMINYADLAGFAIDDALGNLYVPGQQTRLSASTERYAIGLATAPVDNFVTEFMPDVARHFHIQVVIIQRVINQVARTDNSAQ